MIDRVAPATGSALGGTRLELHGAGFPAKAASSNGANTDTLTVIAAGQPCVVESANFITVLCRTAAVPSSAQLPAAVAGVYPGGRGVEVLQWPTQAENASFGWTGSLKVRNECSHNATVKTGTMSTAARWACLFP